MAYGLKVYSGGGFLQLDSSISNRVLYQEVASGTASVTGGGGSGLLTYYGVSSTINSGAGSSGLIFIRPTSPNSTVRNAFTIGTADSFQIYADANISFSYRVFKPSSTAGITDSNWGLIVDNGSGAQQFTNNAVTTRLKGTVTGVATVTGTNLWVSVGTNLQRMIPAVGSPGYIYLYVGTFTSTYAGVKVDLVFPGPQVSDAEDIFTNRWINSYTPSMLVIKD